jgi:hypothetical protein
MEEAATVSSCLLSPPISAYSHSFFFQIKLLSVGCAGRPPSIHEGNKGLPPPSLPVSFMEKAVVLIFLLFLFFTRHSFGSISPVRLIILLMPFSALQFWLRHCQPSGKSAHHHHPLLMNFLGEAATVSVVFLHCPPPFSIIFMMSFSNCLVTAFPALAQSTKGKGDRHCHPPLMSFIGKAATVSVVFLF